jgi:hypothetical protein
MLRFEDRWKRSMEAEAKECQHAARIAAAQAEVRHTAGSSLRLDDAVGETGITTAMPSKTVAGAANKKLTPREMIIFTPARDGWAVAQAGSSPVALSNTNESILQTLSAIKIVVGKKGNITLDELRGSFSDSELYTAAGSNDWQGFIDAFKPPPQTSKSDKSWKVSTPKMVARRFLANALDLSPGTIEKKLSLARTPKKRKKKSGVTLSNSG